LLPLITLVPLLAVAVALIPLGSVGISLGAAGPRLLRPPELLPAIAVAVVVVLLNLILDASAGLCSHGLLLLGGQVTVLRFLISGLRVRFGRLGVASFDLSCHGIDFGLENVQFRLRALEQ